MTETTPDYVTQAAGPAMIPQQAQNSMCGGQPHPPAPPQENQETGAAPPGMDPPPSGGGRADHSTPPPNTERARFSMIFNGTRHALLIKAGTANGYKFSEDVLRAAVPLFEGRPCFVDHGDFSFFGPMNRSVRDLAGHIQNAHYSDQAQGIVADIMFFDTAAWLRDLADQAKNYPYFGLSADLWLTRNEQTVLSITAVESVDTVIHPAAGGTFAIPQDFSTKGNHDMPDNQSPPPAPDAPVPDPVTHATDPALQRQLALLTIQTAGLPAADADAIRAQYEANPCSPQELEQRLALAKTLAAQRAELTTIQGLGQPTHMLNSLDKITLATEKLLGVESAHNADVPRLTGIRELYDMLTGDYERYGRFRPDRVTLANVTTATVTGIVANALNKVLLRSFESRPQWWKPIAYEEDFSNLNQISWISIGGFSDLDTVSEGAAYTEKTWADRTETSTFIKKGNYVGITLEAIDRDDVAAIRAIPRKLGLTAARTLASSVAALFTANAGVGPTLSDSIALFNASHANLGSSALSADSWDACIQAMFQQPELSSSKRLGIRPRYCLVPIELEKTALTIFTSDREPGTANNDANVRRMSDCVITVPEWTDSNDWAAAASPDDLEGVCIGYRFGRAPEIFVADNELTGSMFTNDEMRIKVRFIFAVGIGNYRALYKSNVA